MSQGLQFISDFWGQRVRMTYTHVNSKDEQLYKSCLYKPFLQREKSLSAISICQLLLYREIASIYSVNHMQQMNAFWWRNTCVT